MGTKMQKTPPVTPELPNQWLKKDMVLTNMCNHQELFTQNNINKLRHQTGTW